jgi:PPP family 3-phenylpropionic acid transporter
VNLTQAAMLAPLVPLSDALALSWSRSTMRRNSGAFEYGWVRGIGSAAFIAGVLVAGQSVAVWGCLQFSGSLPQAFSRRHYRHDLCPTWHRGQIQQPGKRNLSSEIGSCSFESPHSCAWCLRPPLLLVAMHDAFAIIRWRDAGISPAVSSVLWSESVGAEVLVFVLLGPWLLGLLGRSGALTLAAGAAVVLQTGSQLVCDRGASDQNTSVLESVSKVMKREQSDARAA